MQDSYISANILILQCCQVLRWQVSNKCTACTFKAGIEVETQRIFINMSPLDFSPLQSSLGA